ETKAGVASFRAPRKQPLLLLLGAEHLERRRHTDRLMRGEQRDHRAALGGDHAHRVAVAVLRESESTVLARDLDAEGPHLSQAIDPRFGNLAGALDLFSVHLVLEEALE